MRVVLDIGSTTIKCVVLDDADCIVYSTYERHYSHILEKGRELLTRVAREYLPGGRALLAISGSAGMGLADGCQVPFVQEVFATRVAANRWRPAPTASLSWAARTPRSSSSPTAPRSA